MQFFTGNSYCLYKNVYVRTSSHTNKLRTRLQEMSLQLSSSSDCDWAFLQLELGFQDDAFSDISQKQDGLLHEELIPDDSEYFFSSSFHAEPVSVKKDELVEVSQKKASCPSCGQDIHSSLHDHVSRCFLQAQKKRSNTKQPKRDAVCSARKQIDSIRQNVFRLDLRQRISIVESLSRLAKVSQGEGSRALFARSQQDDYLAISFLYSTPPESNQSCANLKIECPSHYTTIPVNESCTPTLGARPNPNSKDSTISCSTPLTLSQGSMRPRMGAKRKPDFVQALSFSPELYARKVQRLAL